MILKIQSKTNPNTVYGVAVVNGVATGCNCPSAHYRSGLCKHAVGVNETQVEIAHLACRGRHQVDGAANTALLADIYATVRQGPSYRPTAAQVEALANIVDDVDEGPWSCVEREVLGGLLTALTGSARTLTAA